MLSMVNGLSMASSFLMRDEFPGVGEDHAKSRSFQSADEYRQMFFRQ